MNELLDLELDEVSLVDSPANKSATVALFKRETPMEDEIQTEDELIKAYDDKKMSEDEMMDDDMEDDEEEMMGNKKPARKSYKAECELLKSEVEALKAQIEELSKKDETVEKADEMIEIDGEKVSKSAIPAPVLKKLEEVEKARAAEELRKRADEVLPNFKGTADQRGKLLKSIGDDQELLEMLRAADKLFEGMMSEVGKSDATGDFGSAEAKLEAMAKAYSAEKGMTFQQGYAAVIKTAEGKALLKETYKK
jgi:hypothetical protein